MHSNPLSNITYFIQSPSLICTEFEIATIDGIISIPVISMIHIKAKTEIKKSLLHYLPVFKKKNNTTKKYEIIKIWEKVLYQKALLRH